MSIAGRAVVRVIFISVDDSMFTMVASRILMRATLVGSVSVFSSELVDLAFFVAFVFMRVPETDDFEGALIDDGNL